MRYPDPLYAFLYHVTGVVSASCSAFPEALLFPPALGSPHNPTLPALAPTVTRRASFSWSAATAPS